MKDKQNKAASEEEKLEKNAAEPSMREDEGGTEEKPAEKAEKKERRLSWEELMADEEYRSRFEQEAQKRRDESLPDSTAVFRHLDELMLQAQGLKERFPDFELLTELEDPIFVKLTAPQIGLSLESAYIARHWDELDRAAAEKSLAAVTRSVQSGAARPRELRGSQAASNMQADPSAMSRKERENLKRRIYDAAALGQKIPYGA